MTETLVIERDYYGFPGVGFGGYVAGRLASFLGTAAAEVTLRAPPPLGVPLDVELEPPDRLRLRDESVVVAEAVAGAPDVDLPDPVGPEEARVASQRFAGFRRHAFPMCFCCGPAREEGAGLRIFPGPLPGGQRVAAPWRPHRRFAGRDGTLSAEFVWSALDCPTYWGMATERGEIPAPSGEGVLALTTGRIHTLVLAPVRAGETYVVMGWPISSDGRRHVGGAAVFSEAGEARAVSRATWLPLPRR